MNNIITFIYFIATISKVTGFDGIANLLPVETNNDTSIIEVAIEENKDYNESSDIVEEEPSVQEDIQIKEENILDDIDTNKPSRVIDPTKPMVALTYDDGPNATTTNKILDILEKNNAVATFFELGNLVERYPDVVKREEAIGCEVGNHSYAHKNLNTLSKAQIQADMQKSENAFLNAIGHKTKLFRPPYGNANATVRATIEYPLINWNIDTLDWKSRNADKVIAHIRSFQSLDGRIILMHSIYNSTVKATEIIVPELISKGYQLVTISELAYYRGFETLSNGVIYREFNP